MLETTLPAAIETYNRYRGSVAQATALDVSPAGFRVQFEGSFCTTCCRDDYFDDLRYELAEHGVPVAAVEVEDIERTGRERFEVTFGVDRSKLEGDDCEATGDHGR
ncbi:hypothetical protein ACYJ1Y_12010 [Natrialbaceae archaeon A-gly3]